MQFACPIGELLRARSERRVLRDSTKPPLAKRRTQARQNELFNGALRAKARIKPQRIKKAESLFVFHLGHRGTLSDQVDRQLTIRFGLVALA